MNGVSRINVTENVTMISFNKMPADSKLISSIFEEVTAEKINIDMISQSAPAAGFVNLAFTVPCESVAAVLALVAKNQTKYPTLKPLVSTGNCKISLYGEEMREQFGVASRAISALASVDADIHLITTSEVDISLLVTMAEVDLCTDALKQVFEL